MVRLNGRIALRTNSSDNESGNGGHDIFPKRVGFFHLLGVTVLALKLKEHWDGYRKVPTEPTATNDSLAPPAYRDDDCDTESAIGLDTSISMPMRIRRKKSCCVCCGLNCGLFCKALGIVILIFTIWNGFKLVRWLLTPSPTGLENMPEFSTSLGCFDATHFYQDNKEGTYYTIAVGSGVDHDLVIDGGAVGTIVFAPSINIDDHSIKVLASVRTSDSRLLNSVEVHTPESSPLPPSQEPSTSYFNLLTPTQAEGVDTCMRYDLTIYIPPTLRSLHLSARSVAQVKVEFDDAPRELHELRLDLASDAVVNLVLPSATLTANNINIDMRGGYLVGTLPIANATVINTSKGDAITKLDMFTTGYELPEMDKDKQSGKDVAHLYSISGAGRTDFTYENRAMRPIQSEHIVKTYKPSATELRLTYKDAAFNGKIDLRAPSSSMRNVQSDHSVSQPGGQREYWAGDKEGGDYLKISSPGWVGLYF
ncbi:hypothetical protein ACEPAH_6368 [Sanghuangporus vaninii]